ncbi:N-carbamoylputrescine amidase [Kiloniella laminariae]|uniref:N-carbamoylputrescine amidase n=1 Tax=Kiloniella laminariae TaxID=454162 RepID=UPI00037B5149|nr:N-carbamoylputrescine amidase [Kiloniella laminariae]
MRIVKVAATQMACSWALEDNVATAERLVRLSADQGAQIILLQELFETPYFCIEEDPSYFSLARSKVDNPLIQRFQSLARELKVVLPLSFFEKAGNTRFNSLVVIDADGGIAGHYRKTHIPHSPGYEEKYYFSPGDTGFVVVDTRYGRVGVGICWDQWFPETARSLALQGAELMFFPTAIGSEPGVEGYDSREHWQRVMQGHAGANLVPVIASNRIGQESVGQTSVEFYGSSFVADHFGAIVAEADRAGEAVIVTEFDLDAVRDDREGWGIFRDRRPSWYKGILSLAGEG